MIRNSPKNLLKKIRQGDEKSFARVYDLHVDHIYRFVFLKINSKEKTEEIVQDVFLKFWKFARDADKKIENIKALLYQISRNIIIDYYRSKDYNYHDISLDDERYSHDLSINSDEEVKIDIKYNIEKVKSAMAGLPDHYQEIIIMKFVNELSHKEIADILNKEEGNIRVLSHRALKALKKQLTS